VKVLKIILIIFCAFIGYFSFSFSLVPELSYHFGITKQAIVTNLWIGHGKSTTWYNVRVSYVDIKGQNQVADIRVSDNAYYGLQINREIDIRFLQLFPSHPCLVITPPDLFEDLFLTIATLFLFVVTVLLMFSDYLGSLL